MSVAWNLLLLLSLFIAPIPVLADSLRNFDVIAVRDGKTLSVHREKAEDMEGLPTLDGEIRLVGIWSDEQSEPAAAYKNRVEFLRKLVGSKKIRAPIISRLFHDNPLPPQVIVENERPTEVLLSGGFSLNEILLREGYAAFDRGPESAVREDEAVRFEQAEAEAWRGRRGIWASDFDFYSKAKLRMNAQLIAAAKKENEWADEFHSFATIQVFLIIVIGGLMYLLRGHHQGLRSALPLLGLPVGFMIPDFAHWLFDPLSLRDNGGYRTLFLAYFALLLVLYSSRALVRLLMHGPADQWNAVSLGISRSRSVLWFYAGLWFIVGGFALAFRLFSSSSWANAFHDSLSLAFNLGVVVPVSEAMSFAILAEKVAIILWLGIVAARIRADTHLPSGTFAWNAGLAVASIVIIAIAVPSAFALVLECFLRGEAAALGLDRHRCFLLSISILFRQGSSILQLAPTGIRVLSIIEMHVGFWLALVGFRVIYSLPSRKKAAKVAQAVEAT